MVILVTLLSHHLHESLGLDSMRGGADGGVICSNDAMQA
jgi:hypothetical protein